MAQMMSREVRLAARPKGAPAAGDFEIASVPLPELDPGQILLRTRWISVDPMIRIFIDANPLGGGMAPLPIGAMVPGPAVAEVVESKNPAFAVGDHVEGRVGWRDFAVSDGAGLRKVAGDDAATELGALGLPGFSAYVGLEVSGRKFQGERVLISGAAGAVGSVAGPLAKARGATVVGVASGASRCAALVDQLGYDHAVDRTAADFAAQLELATPQGVDLYFDNVGGPLFLPALGRMNRRGSVLICGLMAQYDSARADRGGDLQAALERIMSRSLTVRAFSNQDFLEMRPAFETEVRSLIANGKLPTPQHVLEGIESVPVAFSRLFTDAVVGKSVVRIR